MQPIFVLIFISIFFIIVAILIQSYAEKSSQQQSNRDRSTMDLQQEKPENASSQPTTVRFLDQVRSEFSNSESSNMADNGPGRNAGKQNQGKADQKQMDSNRVLETEENQLLTTGSGYTAELPNHESVDSNIEKQTHNPTNIHLAKNSHSKHKKIILKTSNLKQAMIHKEILDKPKSLR